MSSPEPPSDISLYTIIGVEPTATQDEIRQAYRAKARQLHPDRNRDDPDANEKFQQLQEAYEVLKNPETRERYDKFGKGDQPQNIEEVNQFELFTQILGLGRSRAPPKGNKMSPTVRMLFVPCQTVYNGGSIRKTTKINVICPRCNGLGSNDGVDYPICPECNGAGSMLPGSLSFLAPCYNCDKVGYLVPPGKRCKECGGRRVLRQKITIDVPIEIGIQQNEPITLPNKGDQYPGKEPADLIFSPMISMPSNMLRDGDDLIYGKELSDDEIKLGTAFTVPHPSGDITVYTKEGTQIDVQHIKMLQGMGMPAKGNLQFKGNLYIIFKATHPGWIKSKFMLTGVYLAMKKDDKKLLEDAPDDVNTAIFERIQNLSAEEEQMEYQMPS